MAEAAGESRPVWLKFKSSKYRSYQRIECQLSYIVLKFELAKKSVGLVILFRPFFGLQNGQGNKFAHRRPPPIVVRLPVEMERPEPPLNGLAPAAAAVKSGADLKRKHLDCSSMGLRQ